MARVKIIQVKPDMPADKVWTMVVNYLTLMESVEVIAVKGAKGEPRLEMHVWDLPRKDDSNTPDVDPQKDY